MCGNEGSDVPLRPRIEAEVVRYARGVDADGLFLNMGAHEISTLKQDIIRQVDTPVLLVPAAMPVSP